MPEREKFSRFKGELSDPLQDEGIKTTLANVQIWHVSVIISAPAKIKIAVIQEDRVGRQTNRSEPLLKLGNEGKKLVDANDMLSLT